MGQADKPTTLTARRWIPTAVVAGLVLLAIVIFRELLVPGRVLVSTDANVGYMAYVKSCLPEWWVSRWIDNVLVGYASDMPINLTVVMLWLLPPVIFVNWFYAFCIVVSSFFLWLYLRERNVATVPALVGALIAFWLGTNFTMLDSGHVGKYGIMASGMACLWLTEKAARDARLPWAILAGGAMGAMFASQPDVALFFALFLGAYAVYAAIREHGFRPVALAKVLVPIPCVALLLAVGPLLQGYRTNVQGVEVMEKENAAQKWDFVTQWSFPLDESIDFIAPGYMGWRTGDPEGPYWGRIGRSTSWEQDRTGLQNFRLDNAYIGALPVGLAIWIFLLALRHFRDRNPRTRDLLFWGLAALAALTLAGGKYSPVYRLFYLLPVVSTVRAPYKFLQILQIAVAILAAFGLDALLRRREGHAWPTRKGLLISIGVVGAVAIVFGLWWITALGSTSTAAQALSAQGWPTQFAGVIAGNKARALGHAALMLALLAAVLWMARPRGGDAPGPAARAVPWLCLAAVVFDIILMAPRYMRTMPMAPIRENVAVDFLKQRLGHQRVSLLSRGGFYNGWLTFVLPYHGIRTLEAPSMPRMPADYSAFLAAAGRDPLRMWQLSAVQYVMASAGVWQQLQAQAGVENVLEIAYGYTVTGDGTSPVAVAVPPQGENAQVTEVILRLKVPSLRFALVDTWETVDLEDSLARITAPGHVPYRKVYLSGASAEGPAAAEGERGLLPDLKIMQSSSTRHILRTVSDAPAVLRFAEKFDPDWEALVDERPVPVLRCDYLFQAVHIPAGVHTVELRFRTANFGVPLQGVGYAVSLAAMLWLAVPAIRKRRAMKQQDVGGQAEAAPMERQGVES